MIRDKGTATKEESDYMKKNRGLTLVEVMVTVAVMGVLAGIVGITIGALLGQRVKSMAADTKSVFQSTQIASMGRDNAYIKIWQDGNDSFVVAYSSEDNEINRAEAHNVSVSYILGNGGAISPSEDDAPKIYFNRQTGGLMDDANSALRTITFTNGRRTITLQISRLTGKVTY